MNADHDVLELIASSARRWSTLSATVTSYVHWARREHELQRAFPVVFRPRSTPPGVRHSEVGERQTVEQRSTMTLRARGQSTVRVEGPDGTLMVRTGSSMWCTSPDGSVVAADPWTWSVGALDPRGWTLPIRPELLRADFDLTDRGSGSVMGRASRRVLLSPRRDLLAVDLSGRGVLYPNWVGGRSMAHLDAATGVILHLESRLDMELVRSFTLSEVVLDEDLSDDLFPDRPPSGAKQVEVAGGARRVEAVAARAGFALLGAEGLHDAVMVPVEADDAPVVVVVQQPRFGRPVDGVPAPLASLTQCPSPAPLPDPSAWDLVRVADGDAWVWQPAGGGEVHVRLERYGTHVWLRGLYDREAALSLAGRLTVIA